MEQIKFQQQTFHLMPFGKYKGLQINQVPRDYLRWLLRQGTLYGWLLDVIASVVTGIPLPETDEEKVNRIVRSYDPSERKPIST